MKESLIIVLMVVFFVSIGFLFGLELGNPSKDHYATKKELALLEERVNFNELEILIILDRYRKYAEKLESKQIPTLSIYGVSEIFPISGEVIVHTLEKMEEKEGVTYKKKTPKSKKGDIYAKN